MPRDDPREVPGSLEQVRVVTARERFVVIDKPAGVLSVPGKDEANRACVASWVRQRFPAASGPLIVHRLDMDTSGLMVLGLDADAQRDLSRQFEARRVRKAYVAVVAGRLEGQAGQVDLPLRADPENRPFQVIDRAGGRPARTAWRVIGRAEAWTRVELTPHTGRTHQLRVHMAAIGHPIIGDVLYAPFAPGPRLMLHATRLAFREPGGGEMIEAESAAPF